MPDFWSFIQFLLPLFIFVITFLFSRESCVLICGETENVSPKIVNTLVSQVQQTEVDTGETKIHFTITSGVSSFAPDTSMDSLIRSADEKLYFGKNNGKNQVVY